MSTADISQETDRTAIAETAGGPAAEAALPVPTTSDAPPETARPAPATAGATAETARPATTAPDSSPKTSRPATATADATPESSRPVPSTVGPSAPEGARRGTAATPVRSALGLRLFGSELGLVFRRRRNQALLLLLGAIPIVVGIALKLSTPRGDDAGPRLITQVAGNGVFLTVGALFFVLPLILPLTISVVAGDSVAGEAGIGTLRYLLAVPAGRTRLLLVKYATTVTFCLAAVATLTATALATGLLLFPVGPVTLLSGSTVSLSAGMVRLLLVALYIAAGVATLAAIGLAVSTVTDSPIAAITTTAVLPVVSQVIDAVPQLSSVHPYLFTHWWYSYDDLLRAPIVTDHLTRGLLTFLAYTLVFGSAAWARFTSKDVTC